MKNMRLLLLLASLLNSTCAFAQGAESDYDRAFALPERFADKVYKETIKPNWFAGRHFWYEISVRGERKLVLIDGSDGTRQELDSNDELDNAVAEMSQDENADVVTSDQDQQESRGKQGNQRRSRANPVSPDGRWRAYFKDHNVFVQDLVDGGDIQLSHHGTQDNAFEAPLYWSPDSKYLAAIQHQRVETRKVHYVDSAPDNQLQPKHFTRDYPKPGDPLPVRTVHVFEAGWDARHFTADSKLVENPFATRKFRWRPDSSGFLFEHIERGFGVHRIVEIQLPSGDSRALIDETSDTFVHVFGKGYRHDVEGLGEIIWRSERDGFNHLYLYDGDTGEMKHQITRGQWVVRDVVEVDEETRQIVFTASGREPGIDPYYLQYYRVEFDGTNLTRLTDGDGTHTVQFSPDKSLLIDTHSRVDMPPRHTLRRACDGKLLCELEQADADDLFASGFCAPERFVAKDRDGEFDIHGIICRPTDFDPEKKYPVVEVIYAGPQGAFVPKKWRNRYGMWRQELAELGFITVQIDGKGTAHRGREFQHFAYKNINDAGFPDRIAWMKAAAEKYPQMDLSRVGIYGGSAGGQNALAALLWHGDFYKAAAADCGCHDNRMDKMWWNEQWMDHPIGPHYDEQSNVTNAHRLTGKLFLTVGELDTNVDPASTLQVVDALIKADKDFEFLLVPGAGHGVGESKYAARRRMDFFVRHLLQADPQEEMKDDSASEQEKDEPAGRIDPVVRDMEGFTVHVDPALLEGEHEKLGKQALTMLANHLQRINILVPAKPLEKLQQVEIWIEHDHPQLRTMQYHPSKQWLIDNGHDPRLTRKVHITQATQLLSRQQMLKHPAVILHELAHGYHDQILGFDDEQVLAAFQKAQEAGSYENVLLYTGKKVRHYALTDHKEYFAEGTEAYFYRNDFYPFVRAELNEHDPTLHDVLTKIWSDE